MIRSNLAKRLPLLAMGLLLAGGLTIQSCQTATEPQSSGGTNVNFTTSTTATYAQDKVDTTNGTHGGAGAIDSSSRVTISSTVVDTNATYGGKTHVAEIVNHYSNGTQDTAYYWQNTNGDLYRYNYGVDVLNDQAIVVQTLGAPIDLGWVLQVEMNSSSTAPKEVARKQLNVNYNGIPVPVTIVDSMQMAGDQQLTVAGSTITTKHAIHSVTASAPFGTLSVPVTIDTYVSTQDGLVENLVHNFTISGVTTAQVQGQRTLLLTHP